nr:hypothetical protein CFP56_74972 [Quercus suber]
MKKHEVKKSEIRWITFHENITIVKTATSRKGRWNLALAHPLLTACRRSSCCFSQAIQISFACTPVFALKCDHRSCGSQIRLSRTDDGFAFPADITEGNTSDVATSFAVKVNPIDLVRRSRTSHE